MRRKWTWCTVLAGLLGVSLLLPVPAAAQPRDSTAAPKHAPQQHVAVGAAPHADDQKAVALRHEDFLAERWGSCLMRHITRVADATCRWLDGERLTCVRDPAGNARRCW